MSIDPSKNSERDNHKLLIGLNAVSCLDGSSYTAIGDIASIDRPK